MGGCLWGDHTPPIWHTTEGWRGEKFTWYSAPKQVLLLGKFHKSYVGLVVASRPGLPMTDGRIYLGQEKKSEKEANKGNRGPLWGRISGRSMDDSRTVYFLPFLGQPSIQRSSRPLSSTHGPHTPHPFYQPVFGKLKCPLKGLLYQYIYSCFFYLLHKGHKLKQDMAPFLCWVMTAGGGWMKGQRVDPWSTPRPSHLISSLISFSK